MAQTKEPAYRKRARRLLTEQQFAKFTAKRRTPGGGMFTTHQVRPRFWASIGKSLAILGLAGFCAAFIATGTVTGSVITVFGGGGIPGTVTVNECHPSGRSTTCTGSFRSDRKTDPVVLNDVVVEGTGVREGAELSAHAGGSNANHVYAGWTLIPLIPLALFFTMALGLLRLLLFWPLRAAIHVFRPDIWPYWVGYDDNDNGTSKAPKPIQIFVRVSGILMTVIGLAFLAALADGIGGFYGLGALGLIAVGGLALFLFQRRKTRSALRRPLPQTTHRT